MLLPSPTFAYDLHRAAQPASRGTVEDNGWVFGLPPGLATHQWPLDPGTGYPMQHGFTLKLPSDYRCHGPEIVALSFFSAAPEHNDGGPAEDQAISAAVLGAAPPDDATFKRFYCPPDQRHPRLHRLTDLLGSHYAVILLTAAEFDGELTQPPEIARAGLAIDKRTVVTGWSTDSNGQRFDFRSKFYCQRPAWLDAGSRAARPFTAPGAPPPIGRLDDHEAIRVHVREGDPNAGKPPREDWDGDPHPETGYHSMWVKTKDSVDYKPWARNLYRDHLGGTMHSSQQIPNLSEFYVEFEEDFGGYNFGGGNAQLDFKEMVFDWACG